MLRLIKKQYAGLDIGSSSVKIAVLADSGSRLAVHSLIRLPLDPALEHVTEAERSAAIAKTIGSALAGMDHGLRRAATNLSGAYAISRTFTLPVMPRPELLRHIIDNAQKYLPVGTKIEDMAIDVQIQRETINSGQEVAQVILAVGRKEMVQAQLHLLEQAGVYPSCIDASAISLFNPVALHPAVVSGRTVAVLEIGHSKVKVLVIRDGMLSFINELTPGSRIIDDRLRSDYGLDGGQILRLKQHLSAMAECPPEGPEQISGSDIPYPALRKVIDDAIEQITREIDRVRKYLKNEPAWDQIIVTGGGAMLPGLAQAIARETGAPAEVLEEISGVVTRPSQRGSIAEFNLAIGLALKKVQQGVNHINLVPPPQQADITGRWRLSVSHLMRDRIAVGLAGLSIVLALAAAGLTGISGALHKKQAAISGEYAAARSALSLNQQLRHRHAVLGGLVNAGMEPDRLMQEIARLAPPEFLLTTVRVKTRMNPGEEGGSMQSTAEMRIEGEAVTAQPLAAFMGSLEKSDMFGVTNFEIRKKQKSAALSGPDNGEAVGFSVDLVIKR